LYGVPWVPTRERRIRKALQLAKLQPGETFYDLGAGDGRVLLMATREFLAQVMGIGIEPVQCALGWLRIWFKGSRHKVQVRCGNCVLARAWSASQQTFQIGSQML
jgi:cyclopropane fatty-acyl-phospholipid synthase-like methyltransferase